MPTMHTILTPKPMSTTEVTQGTLPTERATKEPSYARTIPIVMLMSVLMARCAYKWYWRRRLQAVLENLHNNYYAIRHGESEANVIQIINSDPTIATKMFGLTEKGKEEALKAGQTIQRLLETSRKQIVFYSSDFLRAWDTAQIVHDYLRVRENIQVAIELRERDFGKFDGKMNAYYEEVWKNDRVSPSSNVNGEESAAHVQERVACFVENCEKKHKNCIILFFSHGDTLQILQTYFNRISPNLHRDAAHLHNGEVRKLNP